MARKRSAASYETSYKRRSRQRKMCAYSGENKQSRENIGTESISVKESEKPKRQPRLAESGAAYRAAVGIGVSRISSKAAGIRMARRNGVKRNVL